MDCWQGRPPRRALKQGINCSEGVLKLQSVNESLPGAGCGRGLQGMCETGQMQVADAVTAVVRLSFIPQTLKEWLAYVVGWVPEMCRRKAENSSSEGNSIICSLSQAFITCFFFARCFGSALKEGRQITITTPCENRDTVGDPLLDTERNEQHKMNY